MKLPSSSKLSANVNAAIKWAKDHHNYMENLSERSLWRKLSNAVSEARLVLHLQSRSSISAEEVFGSCLKLRGRVLCDVNVSNPVSELLKQDRSDLISFLSRFALFESNWMVGADDCENMIISTHDLGSIVFEDDE